MRFEGAMPLALSVSVVVLAAVVVLGLAGYCADRCGDSDREEEGGQ